MGRPRLHDQTTAATLLDAAERIVEQDGLAALTVRGVADDVGTTTRAIYSSLGSKQVLVAGLGVRAFDLLAQMVDAIPLTDDPAEALTAIDEAAERALVTLHRRIQRVQDAGGLGSRTLFDATWEFHATCEGLAAVELRSTLPSTDGLRVWTDALRSLVAGWRST